MRTSRTSSVRVVTALAAATALAVGGAGAATAATSHHSSSVPGAPVARSAGVAPGVRAAAVADPSSATLRQLADKAGIKFGTAVNVDALTADPTYRAAVAAQFSSVTPENVMKWDTIEPQRGVYNWTQADQLVAFAKANKQVVRGHTLVWHSQLPAWVTATDFTSAQLSTILHDHIFSEMTHFRGKISQWDVVNEAFNDDGTMRDSIWLQKLGPGYIAQAFRWAHQADPNAKLFYNDYNIEGINAKSDAVYTMAVQLKKEGVPVQGLGIQSHFDVQYGYPTDVRANMQRFADLGAEISVTEADVRLTLPVDTIKLAAQAAGYDDLMNSCLLVTSCRSFTTWGFTDKYSWIPGVFAGEGAALPYDENYAPKPAYDTLRRDLAVAGTRRG